MANYVYIATSLDGYIADKDGGIDWLMEIPNPDNSDFGFSEFMDSVDALIMGRNTFEKVLTFNEWIYNKKVFVLSNHLKTIPAGYEEKAGIVSGDIKDIVADLAKRGYKNLYIDGGKTIQSFLREDMIDEMIITKISILLGDGIPLFGQLTEPLKFKVVDSEILTEFMVKTHYKKKSSTS